MENIIEGLLSEIKRAEKILEIYNELPNNAGLFASTMMKIDIDKAKASIINGDVVENIRCYKELKEYKL